MNIDKNLLNRLHTQDLCLGEKYLWIALNLEPKDIDDFCHVDLQTWADKLNISTRYLQTFLATLESHHLIEKETRPLSSDDPIAANGGGGKFLFVKLNAIETEDNMTFFGTFVEIDERIDSRTTLRLAVFNNVSNINNTIKLSHAFSDLEPNCYNSRALANIEIGDVVVFNGSVRRTEKRISLSKIWNIRPWRGDYDRQHENSCGAYQEDDGFRN